MRNPETYDDFGQWMIEDEKAGTDESGQWAKANPEKYTDLRIAALKRFPRNMYKKWEREGDWEAISAGSHLVLWSSDHVNERRYRCSVLASGLGLPANIAIALSAIAGETFLLVRFQIQLICNLAKLHKVPLDPDDPEDILTILGFAFSGSASELAGKPVTKYGGKWLTAKVKLIFSGGRLKTAKNMEKPLGIKLLQRNIVKYILPIASIGIASTFNYWSTKSVAKVAKQKFKKRAAETKGESVPA